MKHLLLLGGGHSHVEVVRRFGLAPPPDTRVTLASTLRHTPYSGMLPGLVAGHYAFHDCHIDLESLCRWARVAFVEKHALSLDPGLRRIDYADGSSDRFDFVSIDIGSVPDTATVPGAMEHAVPVKPVAGFLAAWNKLVGHDAPGPIAVVGAGAGGVELALAMQHRLRGRNTPAMHLINDADDVLPGHPARVRRALRRILLERRITLHLGSRVSRLEPGTVHRVSGPPVSADLIVWVTGASAPASARASGLDTDARGFIAVGDTLQSVSHSCVFAAGDVATMVNHPRPKSGVYAVRQGPVLAENLRRALAGEALLEWQPQRSALALVSAGNRYAVMSYGAFAMEGAWVWRWKDRIDRAFMARYRGLSHAA